MTFFSFAFGKREVYNTSPCSHSPPSSFGSGPKYSFKGRPKDFKPQYAPKYTALPSTLSQNGISLGRKDYVAERKVPKKEVSPPLNMIPSTIGEGPKVSIHDQHPTKSEVTPGPGQYDPKMIKSGSNTVVGVGRRYYYVIDKDLQDATSYDIPSSFQVKTSNDNRKKTMPRKAKFQKKQHPGPIYNIEKPLGSDARKSAFSKGPRDMPIQKTPGPGDYEISRDIVSHSRLGTSMHVRPRDQKLNDIDVPYYDVPTTIVPKKKSMASRPVTSYETPSPGPAYNIPSTIVPKKVSIGNRTVERSPNADFPGPDAYFQSNAPRDVSTDVVCPLDVSYNRDIINYKEAESLPGPGDYDPNVYDESKEIGFTIKSKERNDIVPDNTAPYRVLQSTLSGPAFSIGEREVFGEKLVGKR